MTNAEYKEFAKEVFNNLTSYFNVIKRQGINISNIGEIFLLAIKKGAEKLDKNIFLYSGADKMNNMLLSFVKRNEEKNPKNIGDLPDSDTTLTFINYYLFLGIRLAINNHSNPEYMLQNLGIENVQEFISKITKVDDINDVVTLSNSVSEIRNYINEDGLCRIFLWGIASHYGIDIIKFCKNESSLFVLCLLKLIKHIGDKYHSICKERVSIILSQLKSLIKNEFHNFEDFIPKDIINAIINNFTKFKSLDKIEELISIEFDKQKYILLDGLFIIYYYIYEAPQHIVKLGFNLMSDNVSSNISGAMISSFQKQDYAELIQYEYEWWCKETGKRLSLLFPFFEGQLDLSKINIVDYDLDKKKAPLQIIVKNDNLSYIDSESPDKDTEQHFGLALKSSEVEYLYNELKGTFLDANTDIRLFCYRLTGKGKPDKIENLKWIADDKSLGVFIQTLGVSKEKCWKKTESFFGTKTNNIKAYYSRNTDPKGILQTNETNSNRIYNIVKKIL